jgi:hypothetical protein
MVVSVVLMKLSSQITSQLIQTQIVLLFFQNLEHIFYRMAVKELFTIVEDQGEIMELMKTHK